MSAQVFLSHSTADKPAVEELARRLVREGIQAWLDRWHLIPGDPWMPAIERALAESETCAVFIGPSGFGPWQNEEMRASIDRRVRDSNRRFRVIPVLLPGAKRAERSSLPAFLAATTWVEFRESLDDAAAFHRLVCGIRGIEPGADEILVSDQCPYRGLRFFDVEDAPFFFGREAVVEWLLNELRPAAGGEPVNRFLAISGSSGSGKSSVARAGLVAALKHDAIAGSSRWPVAICRPGSDPLENLAVALSRVATIGQGASALTDLMAAFEKSEKALHLTVRRSLPENVPDTRLVVVVDQFEEVFTLCKDETRDALIRNLLYAAKSAEGQTLVILTMRADFYGKCTANAELAAALSDHHVLVGPMTDDELQRAIERPTQLVGCEFDAGLVDLLVRDVRNQPGALPLLQHALLELWNKRDGRRLTVKAYHEIGKLEGALQRRADATLKAFLDHEKELCRRTFLRLTQPGEGTEDTKRRASMQELLSLSGKSTATERIIQKLADASLLTTEGDLTHEDACVEVAHEALIRNWPQLRMWIDQDRAGLLTRTGLTQAVREWNNSGRDPAYLYSGTKLAVAEEWAASHPGELNADETEFLRCSREVQQKREASELETAQKLARALRERAEEAEKRVQEQKEAARKLRRRAIAAAGAAVATLILLVTSVLMWQGAREQAKIANEQRLAAQSARAAAEEQARIATTQRLAAQSSEKKANDARDQADQLINFMLFDLSRKLKPIGRLGLLDDVTEVVNNYLKNLPDEAITGPRQRFRMIILNNLGGVLAAQGKLQEALDSYQKGLAIARRLADQDKSNAVWQRDLSVSYDNVGDVLRRQGKLQDALDFYKKGLKILQEKVEEDPSNLGWQRDLSVSFDRVGNILVEQGKLQEALDSYQKGLAIARRLADRDKPDADWQRDLSVSYEKVGGVLEAQGELQDALDSYQQSLNIRRTLADQDKSNADWQRDLSVSYERVGQVLSSQHKLPEALNAYQQDLEIAKDLVDQHPSNAGWQRDLSVSYERVGDVLAAQGKLQDALDAYQQSLNIRRTLADQDKFNAGWQRSLSVSYEKVGGVLEAQGKFQDALDASQQSLKIRQTLAEQDKSNSGWQRDLSVSYEMVGDVLEAQGKLQDALDASQQSLKIRQTLAEQDKSNSGWQRDLIVSLYKVGKITAKIGGNDNITQAQGFLQTGLKLVELYSGQDRQKLIDSLNLALRNLVH